MSRTQHVGGTPSADPLERIAGLLGALDYDTAAGYRAWREGRHTVAGRAFENRSHALQAAMQAERAAAEPPLVAAALLHDIGHALAAEQAGGRALGRDDRHEIVGADWLREHFHADVSEPVRHHVAAKRYLVATRRDYRDHLAADSIHSLGLQGGDMTPDEIEAFRALPGWEAGVQVRLWDDDAKVWDTPLTPLDHYLAVLESVLKR